MKRPLLRALAVALLPVLAGSHAFGANADAPVTAPGDAEHGKQIYQACMACHSIDEDDVGPRHRGVFGRVAGTVPGYAYSPALRNSGITWDAANLDRWLSNPQGLVPGAKMFFALRDARDRADVIAYLAGLH